MELSVRTELTYVVTAVVGQREKGSRFQGLCIRAPENWRGVGLFPRSDVWSLGVTVCSSHLHTPFSQEPWRLRIVH